jgi:hypothetical protein
MEIALINNNSLILGPMGFNVRMINSELEDLEVEERITPQSYTDLPIHFNDGETHLVIIEKNIPSHDPKYYNVGNFTWSIIEEDNVPVKVLLSYPIIDKTLDEVKELRKQEVAPVRREKENTKISVNLNGKTIKTSTSREERILLSTKLSASSGPRNFKFENGWKEVTTENLQYILNEIDTKVQEAFDWELSKLQEIDACETIDDVYNVVIKEQRQNPDNRRKKNEF